VVVGRVDGGFHGLPILSVRQLPHVLLRLPSQATLAPLGHVDA
jgi:hypothetical protein